MNKYIIIREIFKNTTCSLYIYDIGVMSWVYSDDLSFHKKDFYEGKYDNIPFVIVESHKTTLNIISNRLVNDEWQLVLNRFDYKNNILNDIIKLSDLEINHIRINKTI